MDAARLVVTVLGLGLIVAVNLFFLAGRSGGRGERGAPGRTRRGRGETGRRDRPGRDEATPLALR